MGTWRVMTVSGLAGRGGDEAVISADYAKVGESGSLEFYVNTRIPVAEYPYADADDTERGYVPGEDLVAAFTAGTWTTALKIDT